MRFSEMQSLRFVVLSPSPSSHGCKLGSSASQPKFTEGICKIITKYRRGNVSARSVITQTNLFGLSDEPAL